MVIQTVQPDGTSVTNAYYANGLLRQTFGSRTDPVGYTYDYAGRMKTMTTWTNFASSLGAAVTTWNYDGYRGWLTNKAYADGKGPIYGYTPGGRLQTRVWARGITTAYSYDHAGSLATVNYSDSTPGVDYAFDRLGRQIAVTNGATVCNCGYNDVNQVLTESYLGGPLNGLSVTNGYDNLWRRNDLAILNSQFSTLSSVGYGYDAASRLLTVSNGTGTATYSYLANSPLVGQIAFANNGQTVMTTTKHYDFLNRLTTIQSSAWVAPVASFNYQYNSANQRTEVTNVDNSSWVYQYDHLGQVVSGKKYWANGTPVAGQQFTYNFDDIGNRQATASGSDANGNNLRSANYAANSLNQYTSRDVPGYATVLGSANANATVTVNFQRAVRQGNYFWDELAANNSGSSLYLSLTNLAVLNNGTNADIVATNVGSVFLPQTPEIFGYDADGNMTNSGRWTIIWDAENRAISFASLASAPLASQKKVDCAYDFQGRRIQKVVSTNNGSAWIPIYTNRFVYDGWNLIAVLNPQSAVVQSYTWGNDLSGSPQGAGGVAGLLGVTYQGNGTTNCFPAFDGNGNLAGLVNAANGAVLASYEYGPFGEVIRSTGPMAKANPIRFSTKYQDDETDLMYYGHRFYNASTGRWLSRDMIDEGGGLNLYEFVANDPESGFDALGMIKNNTDYLYNQVLHIKDAGAETELEWNEIKWGKPVSCGDGKVKLSGVDIHLHFKIKFAPKANPDGYVYGGKETLKQHEEKHRSFYIDGLDPVDIRYRKYSEHCVCVPCYNAIVRYLNAFRDWELNSISMQNDWLDYTEWPPNSAVSVSSKQDYFDRQSKNAALWQASWNALDAMYTTCSGQNIEH